MEQSEYSTAAVGSRRCHGAMHSFLQDITYSLRSLQRTQGFTVMAVLTLAIGIAANVVVFSVINAALLRPLPYSEPERLVILTWYGPEGRLTRDISASAFFELKERGHFFSSIAAARDSGVNVAGIGTPQYRHVQKVSLNFFRTLGAAPYRGRDFLPEEDQPGGPRAVLLSYGAWVQDYNKDLAVIGSSVRISGEPYTVVGIMPQKFRSFPSADLWIPLRLTPANADAGNEYRVIARLKGGVTAEQARQELATSAEYRSTYPLRSMASETALVPEELQSFIVDGTRRGLYSLFGAVVFVLLITCTNLALCFTVRGASRRHEFAIRAALGSSRWRLISVGLMEAVLIAVSGGILGAIAGKELIPVVKWLAPADLPLSSAIAIDGNVLLFILLISAAAAVLPGIAPALRMSGVHIQDVLRQSPLSGTSTVQQTRLGSALVTAQTALTLCLLAGTASLLTQFLRLHAVSPGFEAEGVSVAQISLIDGRYTTTPATVQLIDQIRDALTQVPGVESVATINGLPLEQGLGLPLYPVDAQDKTIYGESQLRVITPGYFQTMRIPVRTGRTFSDRDDQGGRPVIIVNETLARRWWPNQSAVGKFIALRSDLGSQFSDVPREVVGVVADVHEAGLDRPAPPTSFICLKQTPDKISVFVNRLFPTSVVIRSSSRANLYQALSHPLASADSDLALVSLRPLREVLSGSLARPRFYVSLTGIFGVFALLLTAVGLYGLLSYHLVLRTREIAMRVAVGARRAHIISLIIRQGVGMVLIGIALGALASVLLANTLKLVIYNTVGITWSSLAGAALVLAGIALVTSLLIAVRATAIEPMAVLRSE